MSESDESTAPDPTDLSSSIDDDDDLDFKHQGPIRRNAGLLLAVLVVIVVGPAISRYIDEYRGIVLQVVDGEMFVAEADVPPRWLNDIGAQAGQMIEKEGGSWSPTVVEANEADKKMLDMYARWIDTYEGTITEIIPPVSPNGASIAIIQTDDGRQLDLPLWSDHLAASREGRRVAKNAGTWDPVLLPMGAATQAPKPGGAPTDPPADGAEAKPATDEAPAEPAKP